MYRPSLARVLRLAVAVPVSIGLVVGAIALVPKAYDAAERYDGRKWWGPIEGDWLFWFGVLPLLAAIGIASILIRWATTARPPG